MRRELSYNVTIADSSATPQALCGPGRQTLYRWLCEQHVWKLCISRGNQPHLQAVFGHMWYTSRWRLGEDCLS